MREIFFVFSDESGEYQKYPTSKYLKSHPYYIRSAYIIKAIEWSTLRGKMIRLRTEFNVERFEELKWNEPWRWRNQRKISQDRYRELVEYFRQSLKSLSELSYCKVIYTVTNNGQFHNRDEKDIQKWHIQEIMQRVQMEIQTQAGLAVIFLDPPSDWKKLKLFQEIYREIFLNDQFINDFKNLKDALNFEPSHHSVGIQLADYLSGCFRGFLLDYPESTSMFKDFIYPLIRKGKYEDPLGYGIREVPRHDGVRKEIERKLQKVGLFNAISRKELL